MKIELNTNELKTVLKNLKGNISKHSTDLYIVAKNNIVTIFTTDFKNISKFETKDFTILNEGEIYTNYETIVKLVSKFDSGNIILSNEDNTLYVEQGSKKAKIKSELYQNNDVINRLNEIEIDENVGNSFSVNSDTLNKYFDKARKFISKDKNNVRPILETILLKQNNGLLDIVSLDGFRIAYFNTEKYSGDNINVVINKEIFTEYLKLKVKNENVKISYNEKILMLQAGNYKFISNKTEGDFLKYETLFNTFGQIAFDVNVEKFKKLSRLFETKEKVPVIYNIDKECLKMEQKTSEYELEDKIEVNNFCGDNLRIGFNPNFVSEVLEVVDTENITLNFESELKPVTIVAGDEKYLILPLRI